MRLEVLGAGFGRTGTWSLKLALERLGIGPCYHMIEVFHTPGHAEWWDEVLEGERRDWETILDGYQATVDWPAAFFWRELAQRNPEAKVILTVRDPQSWYQSVSNTILKALTQTPATDDPLVHSTSAMARRLILERTFDGRLTDRDYAIRVFERHNQEVQRELNDRQLLVYEVSEGWEPLCKFLNSPVPDEPFPRVNTTDEFRSRILEGKLRGTKQ